VSLVKQFDSEFPSLYFQEFLDYLSISKNEFEAKVDENRSPHLWSQSSDGVWQLQHAVWID
jgi:hypothetical protein